MNKLKFIILAVIIIIANPSCNKTQIEEVKFPNKVELLVGQYCLPQVVVDEYEYAWGQTVSGGTIIINGETHTSPTYQNRRLTSYTFSDWVSNNEEVAIVKGDTLLSIAPGECEVTTIYHDDLGEHSANCSVTVNDLDIPEPEDTIIAHYGDTILLCQFDVPGIYTIHYELQYGSGYIYSSLLDSYPNTNSVTITIEASPIKFSPLYTYYKNMIVPEFDITSFRVYCEELGFDVTLPIVTLPAEDKGL